MLFSRNPTEIPTAAEALPGRAERISVHGVHAVNGNPTDLSLEFVEREGMERILFGMGCFWGAERLFWRADGVYTTAVGYAAGLTPNPSYEEVCSGRTGHNEVVLVVFDPQKTSSEKMLRLFWEGHDPTQGMRQGNDLGTQYRSGIYVTSDAQRVAAQASLDVFQKILGEAGRGSITSEILDAPEFYYAEDYHQQYLAKDPNGYCGLGGTGLAFSDG